MSFKLPPQIQPLIIARNKLREYYSDIDLRFTLDGNLVGDLGEAVAASLFGLELTGRNNAGIDGHIAGRSVQVKASGTRRGAAFRHVANHADYLLFFHLDFENCRGEVIYNGPEKPVRQALPKQGWPGQRIVSLAKFRELNAKVDDADRLQLLPQNNRN